MEKSKSPKLRTVHKSVSAFPLNEFPKDLSEVVVYEFDTIRYNYELYGWGWNKNNNLVGTCKKTGEHTFTWQPHGSQFTIVEKVSEKKLIVNIKIPKPLNKEQVLKSLGFDKSWVTVTRKPL